MRRALREVGLDAQVQQRKPFLSRKHVLALLRFAQRYENWTVDDWKHIIFSDETKINMFNSYGRSWCWIGDGKRVGPQHVHQTMKHGGGLVMIWGRMAAFRLGAWCRIEGMMDRHMYKFILQNYLWSTIQNNNMGPSRLVFQQYNDPKHTSKIV
jgi:hypothetical protein